ncbi:hypothetical protein AK812_SmicGene21465 [Symbiodinium microadriaticum]|uniref:Methyltransferase FkbM domain-containing protein n=1 Tax=Symbiodinium microadriaticum TaxID=2951 RepID=A0A1Q9DMD5_SYMMI|nr:hypothetical protein AK812_SmicGene21465 [Symbiodinium microadriaticum]
MPFPQPWVQNLLFVGRRQSSGLDFRDLRCSFGTYALDVEFASLEDRGRQEEDMLGVEGATTVDVGANLGFRSIYLAARMRRSALAIEANPLIYRLLLWNIRANNVTDRVWPINAALSGDGSGRCDPFSGLLADCVTLRVDVDIAKSHRSGFAGGSCGKGVACFRVPAWSLGNLLEALGIQEVDHLKLNCEGCEYHVLSDPAVQHLTSSGRLRISGEIHHPDRFPGISSEMATATMDIMCKERLVGSREGVCNVAKTRKGILREPGLPSFWGFYGLSVAPQFYGDCAQADFQASVPDRLPARVDLPLNLEGHVLLKLESAYFEEAEKWDALLEFLGFRIYISTLNRALAEGRVCRQTHLEAKRWDLSFCSRAFWAVSRENQHLEALRALEAMSRSFVVLAVAFATSFLLPLNFVLPVVPRFAPSLSHVALQEKANEKQGPQELVAPVPATLIAMLAGLMIGLFAMPKDVDAVPHPRPDFQLERPGYMQGIDAANAAWRPGEIDFVTRSRLEAAQFPKALKELEHEQEVLAKAPTKAERLAKVQQQVAEYSKTVGTGRVAKGM